MLTGIKFETHHTKTESYIESERERERTHINVSQYLDFPTSKNSVEKLSLLCYHFFAKVIILYKLFCKYFYYSVYGQNRNDIFSFFIDKRVKNYGRSRFYR